MQNFFIAFLDYLGNFKHFEPYLFFRTFDFYILQSEIVNQHYHSDISTKKGKNLVHPKLHAK